MNRRKFFRWAAAGFAVLAAPLPAKAKPEVSVWTDEPNFMGLNMQRPVPRIKVDGEVRWLDRSRFLTPYLCAVYWHPDGHREWASMFFPDKPLRGACNFLHARKASDFSEVRNRFDADSDTLVVWKVESGLAFIDRGVAAGALADDS